MVALAVERGYQCHSALEFLGVRFDLVSQVEDLRSITDELYYLFQAHVFTETPRLLLHELLGWRTEPHFACDLAAFQAVERYLTRTAAWREHVPLTEAFDGWRDVPLAARAVDHLGWQVLRGGKQLSRLDDLGISATIRSECLRSGSALNIGECS